MIQVRAFGCDDKIQVQRWLEARNLSLKEADELPEVGFIVDGVAAGFLRRVEGGYGMIDSLIANPNSLSEIRNLAINMIVSSLLEEAKALGVTKIVAYSTNKSTLLRAERFGFRVLPHTSIALDLSGRHT